MNHKELDVWNLSMQFVVDIYELTKKFPHSEQFGLTNQLRRSAVSIPSKIAEGAVREHTKEYKQFLSIARGSAAESETQLLIAQSLRYIDNELSDLILEKNKRIMMMLTAMIRKMR
ncbi:four helix bundle protein [Saccharicrinis sp. FJH54]|uniref:four helix bundle protein n=1 Tax=Saccharicrinis sp. FJH54 TaxID=3344665 RepID=UPI0035D44BFC